MTEPVVLRTERLILRPASMDDLDDIHAMLSDPVGMRYWSTPPHADRDQTRDWLRDMINTPQTPLVDFVIEYEGRAIGKCGCYRLPEIGYNLRRSYWGKGLATEALRAVIPHVFATHPIAAITADVDPRNLRSLSLLERLGFQRTGFAAATWTVSGEVCDSIFLELKRPA